MSLIKNAVFPAIVAGLALAYCAVLAFHVPVFASMPGWFWPLRTKLLPLVWLVFPILGLGVLAVWLVGRSRFMPLALVPAFMLVGYAVQLGFGFMEGRGLDGLRDRITYSGHAGFAATAVQQESMYRVAANYEQMLATGELPFYPNSTKPPGQLLFYMLTERLSRPFARLMPVWFTPLDRLRTFASWFFPLLSCLVLVPLAWTARMVLEGEEQGQALVLALFLPGLTLITLHLDQCLYPFLAMLCIGAFLHGMKTRSAWPLLVSGAVFYLATYVTFSVVALAPMLVLAAFLAVWLEPRQPAAERPLVRWLKAVGLFVLGFSVLLAVFALAFRYNPVQRYRNAMTYHEQWKLAGWNVIAVLRFGWLNLVEFAVWTGIPVIALFIMNQARTVAALFRRKLEKGDAMAAGLLCVLLLLAFAGRTVGETARLWLFLAPLVALFAAREIPHHPLLRSKTGLLILVALQLFTILAIKRYQDFW